MILERIEILNYKSIKSESIEIKSINGSLAFCFFGANESGKSSLLKAISLLDNDEVIYPQDFHDPKDMVEIIFYYTVSKEILREFKTLVKKDKKLPKEILDSLSITDVIIDIAYRPGYDHVRDRSTVLYFEKDKFENYTLKADEVAKREDFENETPLDLNDFIDLNYPSYFWKRSHQVVFWKSTEKYLLTEKIDLNFFASDPEETSIPLYNSFRLAGFDKTDIPKLVSNLDNPTQKRNLQSKLSRAVTKQINSVWKNHEIEIVFDIDNEKLSVLVEDKGVPDNAKSTNQRSDGFKQFISFILTLSAEYKNNNLHNTLLLIDEPETHLHPKAQIDMLIEFLKISSSNNNIIFYATHSNFLIDKENLSRNFAVRKVDNEKTRIEQMESRNSTFAEINFEVFDIATNEYHSELYGYLKRNNKDALSKLKKTKKWKKLDKDGKIIEIDVSATEYIRHSIHHPENEHNPKFTPKQLRTSIDMLRRKKYNS